MNTTIAIIGCGKGIIFDAHVRNASGAERLFAVLISKTSNGKVAVIFPATPPATTSGPQQYTTGLNHVAFGDSATESSVTTFSPESAQQTILCPFATNAAIGSTSYTPFAYYMPMCQNYNSGMNKFTAAGRTYITNGYWCIEATEG